MRVFDGGWLHHGDGMDLPTHESAIMVIDPPWDAGLWPRIGECRSSIVFCDGQRAGDVIAVYGSPAWVFVWDTVSCWYTPNRPLKKHKLALWFGDVSTYRDEYRDGRHATRRRVSNTRGDYNYVPDPQGKRLIDVFSYPITKSRETGSGHAKPVEWVSAIIQNTRGSAMTVIDPFAGSGAVAVAAMRSGMGYLGAEIDKSTHTLAVDAISNYRKHPSTGDLFSGQR